jgi:hypothetical protein
MTSGEASKEGGAVLFPELLSGEAISRGTGWFDEEWRLSHEEKLNHQDMCRDICRKLRDELHPPPTQIVCSYIADLIEGKKPIGRPPRSRSNKEYQRKLAAVLKREHKIRMTELQKVGHKAPYDTALRSIKKDLAERFNINKSTKTIEKWMSLK